MLTLENRSNDNKMLMYFVLFKENPYDRDSQVPAWWPKYVQTAVADTIMWNDYDGYAMVFKLKEQYKQEFENYINSVLKPFIRNYEHKRLEL